MEYEDNQDILLKEIKEKGFPTKKKLDILTIELLRQTIEKLENRAVNEFLQYKYKKRPLKKMILALEFRLDGVHFIHNKIKHLLDEVIEAKKLKH